MTTVELTATELVVHIAGLDRFFAFKSEVRVPLGHVAGARLATEETSTIFHGLRAPGTYVPGLITAGTFYGASGAVFWDVHHPERAIEISLHDERYAKLVVEVADPAATIAAIEASIEASGGNVSDGPR